MARAIDPKTFSETGQECLTQLALEGIYPNEKTLEIMAKFEANEMTYSDVMAYIQTHTEGQ